ncbi:STAS domain-containing protein, partial [Streptomyces neyagawaensis]
LVAGEVALVDLLLRLLGVPHPVRVSFMDSSGLNLLVQLHRRLHAEGKRLTVTGLQPQPARLLEITETYALFTADTTGADDSAEALTA